MQKCGLKTLILIAGIMVLAACNAGNDVASDDTGDQAEPVETPETDSTPTPVSTPDQATATPEASPTVVHPPVATDDVDDTTGESPSPAPGDGEPIDWHESTPTFYHVDQGPDGEFYLIYQRSMVLVLSPEGEPVDLWYEQLGSPSAIAVDGRGTLSLADRRVHQFDQDGDHLGFLRTDEFLRGELLNPYYLASGPRNNLFISHLNEPQLTVFEPDGESFYEIPEARISEGGPGSLVDFDAEGRMYLLATDPQHGNLVEVRDTAGDVLYNWELEEYDDEAAEVRYYISMMAVAPDGRLVTLTPLPGQNPVAEGSGLPPQVGDYVIRVYSPDGELEDSWKAVEDTDLDNPLWTPTRFTIDEDGTLILPDAGPDSHRIQRFTLDGEFLGEWGHDIPEFLCAQDIEFQRIDCD